MCRVRDDDIRPRRPGRIAQYRTFAQTQVAGEQYAALRAVLRQFQQDIRRTQDVPGVDEGCPDAGGELQGLVIDGGAAEVFQRVERVQHGIEW